MDVLSHGPDADDGEYCRALEAYLCRKNDGHLIRIVGPAFERVCAWAERGVPLKVAYRGIDRYVERYYAKGPRRRPVRIEFCEADVLDVFDEWRRAVGVLVARERRDDHEDETPGSAGDGVEYGRAQSPRGRRSLTAHLDRAIARLTALRAGGDPAAGGLDDAIQELETLRDSARTLRGAVRLAALERLRTLDGELLARARTRFDDTTVREIAREAEEELAPFRARMPPEAYASSMSACIGRIVRERVGLPVLAYE